MIPWLLGPLPVQPLGQIYVLENLVQRTGSASQRRGRRRHYSRGRRESLAGLDPHSGSVPLGCCPQGASAASKRKKTSMFGPWQ